MKVPIEWLKELVNFRAGADQLAEMLTMAGLETLVLPDNVLEVDVLPNRADCFSLRGIAREISALTKFRVKPSRFRVKEIAKKTRKILKVEVRDREHCPRYMARVIENVKVAASPAWLKKRLELAGIRSINNVVDVTNYLLLELGQPMHAFDAAFIAGGEIIVRRANPQEKITTLDGKENELTSDVLVISDKEKAIAIAGVMGGGNSEVKDSTRTVVLESAFFDPASIHKTSKLLKVRTESSVRFEHGVAWNTVEEALDRGAAMIAELGKGLVLGGKVDEKGVIPALKKIELRSSRVRKLLGAEISDGAIRVILQRLGFKVVKERVEVPLYRAADIYREIDLIEEIARIYGYGQIPATMPSTAFPGKEADSPRQLRAKVAEVMVGAGLWEVQTYSMLGSRDFEKCALPLDKAVKIDNPMNIEESIMRTRILPGLLNVLVHNLNRQQENVFIFEMGKVFATTGAKLPEEKWHLCVVATGTPFLSAADKGGVDYFYLKGILENLFHALSIQDAQFMEANDPLLCPGRSAAIEGCGILGELHPAICAKYEINQPVFFFEIDLDAVFPRRVTEKRYRTLPKFPSVARDVAMFVPEKLEHQMITGLIKKTGGEMVEEVYLFDKYKDSLAYRVIYRHPERTLTDLEVNERHAEIVKTLEAKLQVRIRR